MECRKRKPLRATLIVNGSPADRRRALADVINVILSRRDGGAAAAANERDALAARAGRRQAAAAPSDESLPRPAVD